MGGGRGLLPMPHCYGAWALLCVCVCMWVFICACECLCICVCVCVRVLRAYVRVRMYAHDHACTYVFVPTRAHALVSVACCRPTTLCKPMDTSCSALDTYLLVGDRWVGLLNACQTCLVPVFPGNRVNVVCLLVLVCVSLYVYV